MHASSLTRRRTTIVALLLAVTVLPACGRSASGRTAARIGDEKVSSDSVVAAVDRALAAGPTELTRKQLAEEHLTTLVKLALYRSSAATRNLAITDELRSGTRAAFEEQTAPRGGLVTFAQTIGIAEPDLDELIEVATLERLLSSTLGAASPVTDADLDSLRAANPNMPSFEDSAQAGHILVAEEALAKKVLAELKAGGDFAALAAKYSIDPGSKDSGGVLGPHPQPAGSYVPEFEAALATAKPGEVVGPVKTQFGYHLITIRVTSGAEVRDQVRKQAVLLVGRERLKAEVRKGPAVTVNSRFGRWDAAALQVVSPDGADSPSAPKSGGLGQLGEAPGQSPAPSPSAQ